MHGGGAVKPMNFPVLVTQSGIDEGDGGRRYVLTLRNAEEEVHDLLSFKPAADPAQKIPLIRAILRSAVGERNRAVDLRGRRESKYV